VHPTKIQVIHDWPSPSPLTKLRIFLGLSYLYHKFVLGFSNIAWALSQVTRGGGKEKNVWVWSEQQSFNDLKQCLFSSLVLSLSYLQQPFNIETYSSDYVVGVILNQHDHPMAYHSETLLDVVCKYPTYDKEI
jgi:hypothetical protein